MGPGKPKKPRLATVLAEKPPEAKDWTELDGGRAQFLYAPFKLSRSINPRSWDNRLAFWGKTLLGAAQAGLVFSIDPSELPYAFKRADGLVPLCLGTVLQSLIASGELVPADQLGTSPGWTPYLVDTVVVKPVSWIWGMAAAAAEGTANSLWGSPASSPAKTRPGRPAAASLISAEGLLDPATGQVVGQTLVVLPVVEKWAKRLLDDVTEAATSPSDLIIPLAGLNEAARSFRWALDSDDWLLLVRHLEGLGKARLFSVRDEPIVRFGSSASRMPGDGSSAEQAVGGLKLGLLTLAAAQAKRMAYIEELRGQAVALLRKGRKDSALTVLRRKKLAAGSLSSLSASLENLHTLLDKIQNSELHGQVLSAMESGGTALAALNASMDPEAVQDVLDTVQEAMDDSDELANAVAELTINGTSDPAIEADETAALEAELDAILGEEAGRPDPGPALNLPSVPTEAPRPVAATPPQGETKPKILALDTPL